MIVNAVFRQMDSMPRTFLVKRNGEGQPVLHTDCLESRDLSDPVMLIKQTEMNVDNKSEIHTIMRPDCPADLGESRRDPSPDLVDRDVELGSKMETDDAVDNTTPHMPANEPESDKPSDSVQATDSNTQVDNHDDTHNSAVTAEGMVHSAKHSSSDATNERESDVAESQETEKKLSGEGIKINVSPPESGKNSSSTEVLNLSGGESTAVVLTKALKTLVSSDYEVITPPRQPAKKPDQDPVEKKITLFRPYDLDNSKSSSSDRSRNVTTESPMLLRSNYSSTEKESAWCIEQHSKSESAGNNLTNSITTDGDKAANSEIEDKQSDRASVRQNVTVFSKLSDSEKIKSDSPKLKLSLKATEANLAPVLTSDIQIHPSVPAHVFKPLKSSTPKKITGPLSLEAEKSIACSKWPNTVKNNDILKEVRNDNPTAHVYSNRLLHTMPHQFCANSDYARYLQCLPVHHKYQMADLCTENRQFHKYYVNLDKNAMTPAGAEAFSRTHRNESLEGHRLPLKHSYKHQSCIAEPPDRGRLSMPNTDGEKAVKERFRSSSCPPIPSEHNTTTLAMGPSIFGSYSVNRNAIFSNSRKAASQELTETWASQQSVMTSDIPADKTGKLALPSFATFSNTAVHHRPYTPIEDDQHSSQEYKANINENMDRKNGKHSRSKSESMIKSTSCASGDMFGSKSHDLNSLGLERWHPAPSEKVPSVDMASTNTPQMIVPVSCYRNECTPQETRNSGLSNKSQMTKCRTWHVPKQVASVDTSLSNTLKVQPYPPQQDPVKSDSNVVHAYSSHYVPETSFYSSNLYPRPMPNFVSSQVGNVSAFPDPKITLQYLDHQRKLIADASKGKVKSSGPVDQQFKPEVDLYKDRPRVYQDALPYAPAGQSMVNQNAQTFTKPMLGPGHGFPGLPSVRFGKDTAQFGKEMYARQMAPKRDTPVPNSLSVPHVVPAPEPKQVQLLHHPMPEARRPLGTSALQNKSPAPATSAAQTDSKLPLAAVLLMMKSQSQGASIEMINGGYGIKNPTYTAPKIQDFPDSEKAPSKFVCKFCQKEFGLQRLLNRHLKCHSDTKRYLCTFCGKGFNDTFDLKRHTRIHTGVKPYKCPSCDKAFTQRCSLESHSRKVHGAELPFGYKQRRTKVYVCEDCGHSTSDPDQHFRHLQQNHPYCPALTRCHDKRQFKFKTETTETDLDLSTEVPGQPQSDNVPCGNSVPDENTDASNVVSSFITPSNGNPEQPISVFDNQGMCKMDSVYTQQEKASHVIHGTGDVQMQHSSQMTSTTKRRFSPEIAVASPKKMKSTQSPKKTGMRGSPMKCILGSSRSDSGFVSPRFDIENIMSQKTSVNGNKKVPLGSLSGNSMYIHNSNEAENTRLDKGKLFERSNVPMVTKLPLGNTTQNTQW